MSLIRVTAPSGVFGRAPVALVICQVQFEPILRLSESGFVAPFQEAVRDRYPALARVGGIQLSLGSEGLKAEEVPDGAAWSFTSSDEKWQVVLAQSALTLQSKEYASYEDVRDRFLDVLQTFVAEYAPGARTRVALRYINRITFDDADNVGKWRALVRREALGLAADSGLAEDETIRHSFCQTRFAQDASQMIVKYGLLEPGTVTHPDIAAPDVPYFVLDLDHFDIRRMPSVEIDLVREQLDSFHDDIHRVFRWVLTDAAVERLGIADTVPIGVGSR